MTSVEHTSCGICHEDIDAKTGVLKTSCAHVYHPTCLWKWYSTNEANTCPMCRAPATEWEAVSSTRAEEEDEIDGLIRITRVGMEREIIRLGGYGLPHSLEAELGFDEYGEAVVSRHYFQRILRLQGAGRVWDSEWNRLLSMYPDFTMYQAHQGAASALPEVDVTHAPGPFDFPDSSFTLRRGDVEGLLQAHGSRATMVEFFNEEDGEEETLVVTMTLDSLNDRFASLGATPVVAAELQPDRLGAFADRLGAVVEPPRRAVAPGQYSFLTTFATVLYIMLLW